MRNIGQLTQEFRPHSVVYQQSRTIKAIAGTPLVETGLVMLISFAAVSCSLDPDVMGGSAINEQEFAGETNEPPIARLAYEIELNVWIPVQDGDMVVRPLNLDINWDACASADPDGVVVRIVLDNGLTSVLLGNGIECGEHDETNHDPRNDRPSFLLVTDDDGAQTKLNFIYRTE